MCLAIPGKVLEVKDQEAKVDFGDMQKDVFLGHVKAEVGDYILVGAGMAVTKIDEKEALDILDVWKKMK
jgi:hydrogenase expression/formation protein HypC